MSALATRASPLLRRSPWVESVSNAAEQNIGFGALDVDFEEVDTAPYRAFLPNFANVVTCLRTV